jgi:hypothetical protein
MLGLKEKDLDFLAKGRNREYYEHLLIELMR